MHRICSFTWADNFWIMSHSKEHLERMLKDLIEEANWTWNPNRRVCGGPAHTLLKKRRIRFWTHRKAATNFHLKVDDVFHRT